MPHSPRKLALALVALAAHLVPALAGGQPLAAGDIVVTDRFADRLIRIDPATGAQSIVPSGGSINSPFAVAFGRTGLLFVTTTGGGVWRIDAANDSRDLVRSGPPLIAPRGIAIGADGDVFVVENPAGAAPPAVWRIDPALGTTTVASDGGHLLIPLAILTEPQGSLLVTDGHDGSVPEGLFRVFPEAFDPADPGANQEVVIESDTLFGAPRRSALQLGPDGEALAIFTTDSLPQLFCVDPAFPFDPADPAAHMTVVTSGGLIEPIGIGVEGPGSLFVVEPDAEAVLRISFPPGVPCPAAGSGTQSVVSSGGLLDLPWDLQIVPEFELLPDLFVLDAQTPAVLRVDAIDGSFSTVSSGGLLAQPTDLALDARGDLHVSDAGAGAVLRVDPATGAQTTLLSGLTTPVALALEPGGHLAVVDAGTAEILRVNPLTGASALVSSGGLLVDPADLVAADDGTLYVADRSSDIIRVDPQTGVQTAVSTALLLVEPVALALRANGKLFVADAGAQALIHVDPADGTQTLLASGGSFSQPSGLALQIDGFTAITDAGSDALLRVDPLTGAQATLLAGGPLLDPVAVVPDDPPLDRILDDDGDSVADPGDNCLGTANPGQLDTNQDGFGNACDADYSNDGLVLGPDFVALSVAFGSTPPGPPYDPDIDLDGDGTIGGPEFNLLSLQYGGPPGPSGLPCAGTTPCVAP